MARTRTPLFTPHTFLSEVVGRGKTILPSPNKQMIFSQGDPADAVFYIQAGKVKLTVVSQQGKEAVVAILEEGAFFGESCLAGHTVRTATATTVEDSTLVRIDKEAMIQVLSHGGPAWDEKPRKAVTRLDEAFRLSYGLSYERKAVAVATTEVFDFSGEPPGTRTQGPRLKRAMLYRLS